MRRLWLALGVLLGLWLIFTVHLTLIYFLPYPYHTANFLLAILVTMLLVFDSGKIVWFGCALFWCLELYTGTPYGIVLYAGTLTMLFMYWLYGRVITNRSFVAACALTTAAVVSYRAVYTLLLFFSSLAVENQPPIAWTPLFEAFGWEILFTNVLMIIMFGVIRPWLVRLGITRLRQL